MVWAFLLPLAPSTGRVGAIAAIENGRFSWDKCLVHYHVPALLWVLNGHDSKVQQQYKYFVFVDLCSTFAPSGHRQCFELFLSKICDHHSVVSFTTFFFLWLFWSVDNVLLVEPHRKLFTGIRVSKMLPAEWLFVPTEAYCGCLSEHNYEKWIRFVVRALLKLSIVTQPNKVNSVGQGTLPHTWEPLP